LTAFVALLRAVNVGNRQLVMAELKALADTLGLDDARTFIASGNLLFRSDRDEADLKALLERAIGGHMGAEVPVMVRTADEMAEVERCNPFPDHPGKFTYAFFLDQEPPPDAIAGARNRDGEEIALGKREIYIAYGDGMGQSKLRLPAAMQGTARNMNTVAKLARLTKEMA
jgi:uncharacterized protein (DUF1697 family)